MDASYNEMDVNMFNQYMYKSNDENLDVSLSVPQYSSNNGQQQQSVNQSYHEMADQTFHTPSFGDEEFDIPELHQPAPAQPQHHQLDQYHHQLQNHQMGLMNEQQTVPATPAYSQWHHQQTTAESHLMTNQTYQLQSPNHSNYHHMPNQQMLLMQPNALQSSTQNQQHLQQHHPQMSPQLTAGGTNYIGQSPSQTNGSDENEDSDDNILNDPNNAFKRPSPDPFAGNESPKASATKKAKPAARKGGKKKKDPNEPQKPVSAYALFFRDTQAAIKGQNPNASFGEVSKIVASMWDVLSPEHKNVYKKKTEAAKKDYLKALAAYRASLVSQGTEESQSPPPQQQQIVSPSQNNPLITQSPSQLLQPTVSPHQIQSYTQQPMTQTYQQSFVNQSMMNPMNQNMIQNTMMNMPQQHTGAQNQYMNQQLHQMNQSAPPLQQQQLQNIPTQQINQNINNNHLPPVSNSMSNSMSNTQNCIRSGCNNAATISPDWEDEYCSNECVIHHCRDVFGNWVQNQVAQPQNCSAVK